MKRLLLHVACMCIFASLCASSCMTGNKSLPLAFRTHECVSEPEWPEAILLEQCWDQSTELWQPMSGFPWPKQQSEAHTCTRWLQVDQPVSNWTINAALKLTNGGSLPYRRHAAIWPSPALPETLCFSFTVDVMTERKSMQSKQQDELQFKTLMWRRLTETQRVLHTFSSAFGIHRKRFLSCLTETWLRLRKKILIDFSCVLSTDCGRPSLTPLPGWLLHISCTGHKVDCDIFSTPTEKEEDITPACDLRDDRILHHVIKW